MNKTIWVAIREFKATVLTKAFLIAVALPPVMMVVMSVLMPLLMNKAAPRVEGHIAIIDRSGLVAPRVEKAFERDEVIKHRAEAVERGMNKAPLPPEIKEQAAAQAKMTAIPGPELHVTCSSPRRRLTRERRRSWPPKAWRRMPTAPIRAWH